LRNSWRDSLPDRRARQFLDEFDGGRQLVLAELAARKLRSSSMVNAARPRAA
jgi:hypothetical protein